MLLQFKQPNITDTDKMADLITQLGYPVTSELMAKQMEEYLIDSNNHVYLATKDNTTIGLISFTVNKYLHRQGKFARITALVVDKSCRSQGIGKALIKYAENIVINLNCNMIELTSGIERISSGTHAFYNALGYMDMRYKKSYFRKSLAHQIEISNN